MLKFKELLTKSIEQTAGTALGILLVSYVGYTFTGVSSWYSAKENFDKDQLKFEKEINKIETFKREIEESIKETNDNQKALQEGLLKLLIDKITPIEIKLATTPELSATPESFKSSVSNEDLNDIKNKLNAFILFLHEEDADGEFFKYLIEIEQGLHKDKLIEIKEKYYDNQNISTTSSYEPTVPVIPQENKKYEIDTKQIESQKELNFYKEQNILQEKIKKYKEK